MPLYVDGVEIETVFVDGVEMEEVYVDGNLVFQGFKGLWDGVNSTVGAGGAGTITLVGFQTIVNTNQLRAIGDGTISLPLTGTVSCSTGGVFSGQSYIGWNRGLPGNVVMEIQGSASGLRIGGLSSQNPTRPTAFSAWLPFDPKTGFANQRVTSPNFPFALESDGTFKLRFINTDLTPGAWATIR